MAKFDVKVLGSGCKRCHELHENVLTAVKNAALDCTVEYVTDMQKIMEAGVMSMPAVMVNGKVVSCGKVLSPAEVEQLLYDADSAPCCGSDDGCCCG